MNDTLLQQFINLPFYERMFAVTCHRAAEPLLDLELACLASTVGAEEFVRVYAPQIKAETPDVSATYFASWIGRLCAAVCYGMWHDRLDLGLTPDGVFLHMEETPGGTSISFRLACLDPVLFHGKEEQEEFLVKQGLEQLFARTIAPVVDAVADAGGISPGSIWSLMATGFHYMLDRWHAEETDGPSRERLERLADILINRIPPEAFGRLQNPFRQQFVMTRSLKGDSLVRIKGACCLAYKTKTDHGYCFTCPRINEEERGARRAAAVQS